MPLTQQRSVREGASVKTNLIHFNVEVIMKKLQEKVTILNLCTFRVFDASIVSFASEKNKEDLFIYLFFKHIGIRNWNGTRIDKQKVKN